MIDPLRAPVAHRGARRPIVPGSGCAHIDAVPRWSVVVPAKRLDAAKTRLRPLTAALDDGDAVHRELVLALLADTVSAAAACAAVDEVLVVTDDPAAAELVARLGARTVADEPGGLNPALEHGARRARATAVAALSSDLPALRPDELAAALLAAGELSRAFVADVHGTGTTLLTAVGTGLRPHFGVASARAHRATGALPLHGGWPGLVHDVDTPADLRAALALGVGRHTSSALKQMRTADSGR
jgi:2-phospho-L-lactate guanylyltransferase